MNKSKSTELLWLIGVFMVRIVLSSEGQGEREYEPLAQRPKKEGKDI